VVDTAGHTDSGGPVLGTFQRGRKHMEAVMSVDVEAQPDADHGDLHRGVEKVESLRRDSGGLIP
jgi:hypothetical protein